MIYLAQFFLEWEMFQTKFVEKFKKCYVRFCFSENQAVYEIMWKNTVQPDRSRMTIWRIACWITKTTNTYSEKVILTALPLQQWLRERVIMLHYMNIACPVLVCSDI